MQGIGRFTNLLRWALMLILGVAVFFALLGRRDIVTSHEARVAQVARIMASSGWMWNATPVTVPVVELVDIRGEKEFRPVHDGRTQQVNPWLVPVINNQLRLQKPPLPYWCSAAVYRIFGYEPTRARYVPAMLGVLAMFLVADLARIVLGKRAALIAAGVWCSTHFIVDEFRKCMADPYLAFFTLLGVWAWLRSTRLHAGRFCLLFYVALALGGLAKGPVIFLTTLAPVFLIRLLLDRRGASWRAHLAGGFVFLLIVIPWPWYVVQQVPRAIELWRYETVNIEKARPWFKYIGHSFELPLPWTPMWLAGLAAALLHGRRSLRGPRGRRRLIPIGWFLLIALFFSLLPVKKPAYLLPAVAAQTLTITEAIVLLLAFARRARFRGMPAVLATAQALIGIGFAAGLAVVLLRGNLDRTVAITAGGTAVLITLLALIPILRRSPELWVGIQVPAYVSILIVLLGLQRPDEANQRSGREFAAALAEYLQHTPRGLLIQHLPEDLSVYLPLDLPDAGGLPYALMVVDHSPRDPEETPQRLSDLLRDAQIVEARHIRLDAPDGNGRWRLFEVTIQRPELHPVVAVR